MDTNNQSKNHCVVETTMNGSDALWRMATVTGGKYVGKTVCIMVEFACGNCICDLGNTLEVINIKNIRTWKDVRHDV